MIDVTERIHFAILDWLKFAFFYLTTNISVKLINHIQQPHAMYAVQWQQVLNASNILSL